MHLSASLRSHCPAGVCTSAGWGRGATLEYTNDNLLNKHPCSNAPCPRVPLNVGRRKTLCCRTVAGNRSRNELQHGILCILAARRLQPRKRLVWQRYQIPIPLGTVGLVTGSGQPFFILNLFKVRQTCFYQFCTFYYDFNKLPVLCNVQK